MFQDRSTCPRPVYLILIEDFCQKFYWIWNSGSRGDFYFKICRPFCPVMGKSLWNFETILSPPVLFLLTVPKQYFFCGFGFVFDILSSLCLAVLWSPDGKGMISCLSYVWCFLVFFITFPFEVLVQVWYLIVSIPDLCILPHFGRGHY